MRSDCHQVSLMSYSIESQTYPTATPLLDEVQGRNGPNDGDSAENRLNGIRAQAGTRARKERVTVVVCPPLVSVWHHY